MSFKASERQMRDLIPGEIMMNHGFTNDGTFDELKLGFSKMNLDTEIIYSEAKLGL